MTENLSFPLAFTRLRCRSLSTGTSTIKVYQVAPVSATIIFGYQPVKWVHMNETTTERQSSVTDVVTIFSCFNLCVETRIYVVLTSTTVECKRATERKNGVGGGGREVRYVMHVKRETVSSGSLYLSLSLGLASAANRIPPVGCSFSLPPFTSLNCPHRNLHLTTLRSMSIKVATIRKFI